MDSEQTTVPPPVSITAAKRLSFDRADMGDLETVTDTFLGAGKSDGCVPSASWEELCVLAHLITTHPAYVTPTAEQLAGTFVEDPPAGS